jgi:oligopeptide transport system substrate-binding protein
MKKTASKLLAVVLAMILAMGTLSGCTGKNKAGVNTGKPITDLVTFETSNREMESYCMLNSQQAADLNVLCNCNEGLLETNNYGKLVPGLAEKWETKDGGLTWTFNLRKGVKWVDINGKEMADCNAQDFITGLEFILNHYKNDAANTSMPFALIKGAEDYYNYTKSLTKEEALALDNTKFLSMVGIKATDDYTLVYTCPAQKPYFDTVATYNCLYPASKKLIDQLTPAGYIAADNTKIWYNGPYILKQCVFGNQKRLEKNPTYWDKECTLFDSVTIKIVESLDSGIQLYQTGDIHNVDLTQANLTTIHASESNEYNKQLVEKLPTKYSFQYHFNYHRLNKDGSEDTNWNTAVANKNFRLAWYYGIDFTKSFERGNSINPYKEENNAYTYPGLVYMKDGTEYTEYVKEKLGIGKYTGKAPVRYDKAKGAEYKKKAMDELKAKGVTFPIQVNYWFIAGSQTAKDSADVLKQIFSECLGDDFVVLNENTYIKSQNKEVTALKLQSFNTSGWGADYGDPMNFLGQETYDDPNAYYANAYSNINEATDPELIATYKKFTELVKKADAINDDLDARYKAFADAEVLFLQNVLTLPHSYEISWQLTHINDYSKPNAAYGCQNYLYKNWETSVDAYTTEQYEELAKEYQKGMTK